jgi:hypothetical protein
MALLALLLLVDATTAADLKSGPQVGEKLPGAFRCLNVNGPDAGQKVCLYCKNGDNPVVMIFARRPSAPLLALIKQVDTATAKHSGDNLGSFVVFLGTGAALEKELREAAARQELKHTVLAVYPLPGPEGYQVAAEAEVTVVLYTNGVVKTNSAFRKGELQEKDVERVLAGLPLILPKK